MTVLSWMNCFFTQTLSLFKINFISYHIPSATGFKGSLVKTFIPIGIFVLCLSSCAFINTSLNKSLRFTITSNPLFSANVFGIINKDSANACMANLAFPVTLVFKKSIRCSWHAISKAPPPGTTALSSIAFYFNLKKYLNCS